MIFNNLLFVIRKSLQYCCRDMQRFFLVAFFVRAKEIDFF